MTSHFQDPYCYPGTSVLINLRNIRDRDTLELAEGAVVSARSETVPATYTSPHHASRLLFIHKTLFGDLYPFAGKLRIHTGRMTKTRAGGNTVVYCDSAFVPSQLEQQFTALKAEGNLLKLKRREFAQRAAHFYGELDAIHPFREGNSRTLRLFFSGIAHQAGLHADWGQLNIEAGRQHLYAARDRAVMKGDSSELAAIFASILSPLQST